MGFGASVPTPSAVPPIPAAAQPATLANPLVAESAAAQRTRAAALAGGGFNGTIGTSAQGVTTPTTTAPATLLGGGTGAPK